MFDQAKTHPESLAARRWVSLLSLAALLGTLAACSGSGPNPPVAVNSGTPDPAVDPAVARTRYSFNNGCFAIKSKANQKFLQATTASQQDTYAASTIDVSAAHAFFLKPSALGEYLLYDKDQYLVAAGADASNPAATVCSSGQSVCSLTLANATDFTRFVAKAAGDLFPYPPTPQFNIEPAKATIDAYQNLLTSDPQLKSTFFTFDSQPDGRRLAVDSAGALGMAPPDTSDSQQFTLVALEPQSCALFPEAVSGAAGTTLKGTTSDGRVLGIADVHVHIGSTTFLGGDFWGTPFHKFGVTHALGDCTPQHGQDGSQDIIGGFLENGGDPRHPTDGWPTFTAWPAAGNVTHQAVYWRWLERAWMAGLRIVVNDLVENATLCELQKNNSHSAGNNPSADCNEMNEAGKQAGTMYAMQDYIDAQYGGPGAGWLRIVYSSDEARQVVAQGKLAMVLGIEVSNFLNCQVTYNPARTQEPYQETGSGPNENSYACAMTESNPLASNEILYQMNRIHDWGVRQVISIHEFDSALGGNGLFFPFINLGNRENSGGIPSGASGGFQSSQTPTGEFWTTYDCPLNDQSNAPIFTGYFWDSSGGASGQGLRQGGVAPCNPSDPSQCLPPPPSNCTATGQGGRYGGTTPCYPDRQQCNARWMTPIGAYVYKKLMKMGFLFDFDHMELGVKSQALAMTETQAPKPAYPIISTHGTFGGTSKDQARRVLRNGGFLYPSLGSSTGLRNDMDETLNIYKDVFGHFPDATSPIFGFGFGTDTNGLSTQAGTESGVTYPYTLFTGGAFDSLPDFTAMGVSASFAQPEAGDRNADGTLKSTDRKWDIATDGSATYGMLSDMVAALKSKDPKYIQYVYNSAERYLQTWKQTEQASGANFDETLITDSNILRAAPSPLSPGYPYK